MDVSDPSRADCFFDLFDAGSDFVRRFNVVDFNIYDSDTQLDVPGDVFERLEIVLGAVSELEDQMVGVEFVQETDQGRPGTALNDLAAVVAEAEMNSGPSALRCGVEDAIDGSGGNGTVVWIAWYVGFVDLEARAGKVTHLLREHIGDEDEILASQSKL